MSTRMLTHEQAQEVRDRLAQMDQRIKWSVSTCRVVLTHWGMMGEAACLYGEVDVSQYVWIEPTPTDPAGAWRARVTLHGDPWGMSDMIALGPDPITAYTAAVALCDGRWEDRAKHHAHLKMLCAEYVKECERALEEAQSTLENARATLAHYDEASGGET